MNNNLSEKINQVTDLINLLFEDSDFMFVLRCDDRNAFAGLKGNAMDAAQTLFYCIHKPGEAAAMEMYGALKQVFLNIIGGHSPYRNDLLRAISDLLEHEEHEMYEQN